MSEGTFRITRIGSDRGKSEKRENESCLGADLGRDRKSERVTIRRSGWSKDVVAKSIGRIRIRVFVIDNTRTSRSWNGRSRLKVGRNSSLKRKGGRVLRKIAGRLGDRRGYNKVRSLRIGWVKRSLKVGRAHRRIEQGRHKRIVGKSTQDRKAPIRKRNQKHTRDTPQVATNTAEKA